MSAKNSHRPAPAAGAANGIGGADPLRLFFDARYIRTDFHDGISRFSAELAAALATRVAIEQADTSLGSGASGEPRESVELVAPGTGGTPVSPIDITFLVHDDAQVALLPTGARTLKLHAPTSWREPFASLLLNRYRPDVVFSPMQTIGSLGRRFALILSLHDTIYYRHRTPPRDLPWPVRLGWRLFHLSYLPQRLVLNAADVVATVSETSKRQFEVVRLTKRPVVVLANAPQQLDALLEEHSKLQGSGQPGSVSPAVARSASAPRNIVYMGSFMPYKNVETIVRAMRELPEHTLHLLSRISDARRRELERLAPGASIVFHGGVSDVEYAQVLDDRALLATLSLDEGYGLPIAEALAFGVPAVVSELEIFREVAGDGALYVPARDAAAFARAVRSLDDDELRAELVARGRAHAGTYSWEKSATTLLSAVREVRSARRRR